MNWPRIILDGLAMSLLFNAVAGLGFLIVPQAYSTMFPKEIKAAAAPYVRKEDVRTMKRILYPLYLVLFVWWAFSACTWCCSSGGCSARASRASSASGICFGRGIWR